MGLSESEFWNTTLRTLTNRIKGYTKRQEDKQRTEWERTRWQTCVMVNMLSSKRVRPVDLLRLPWDNIEPPRPLTAEERKQRFGAMDKRIKEQYQKHGKK